MRLCASTTFSANGNMRYAFFTSPATPRVRLMKRIVNLPMALRRSKLRHSARPPDITASA
jgi:hypothetical protein